MPQDSFVIIGVNTTGSTGEIYSTSFLPYLNDTANTQSAWGAAFRDVVVLDENNEWVATHNCTSDSLHDNANYQSLRSVIVNAIND